MPEQSRWEYLLNEAHQKVGSALNKALSGLEEHSAGLEGVLEHIDFTRKVGAASLSDKKLRDLIVHFSTYRLRNEDFEFPDLRNEDTLGKLAGLFAQSRLDPPAIGLLI